MKQRNAPKEGDAAGEDTDRQEDVNPEVERLHALDERLAPYRRAIHPDNPTLDTIYSFGEAFAVGAIGGTLLSSSTNLLSQVVDHVDAPQFVENLARGAVEHTTVISGGVGATWGTGYALQGRQAAPNVGANVLSSLAGGTLGGVVAQKTFGPEGFAPVLTGAAVLMTWGEKRWNKYRENMRKNNLQKQWDKKFANETVTSDEVDAFLEWGGENAKAMISRSDFPGIDAPIHREHQMDHGIHQMFEQFGERAAVLELTEDARTRDGEAKEQKILGKIIPKDHVGNQISDVITLKADDRANRDMIRIFEQRRRNQEIWDSVERDAGLRKGEAVSLELNKEGEKQFGMKVMTKTGNIHNVTWDEKTFVEKTNAENGSVSHDVRDFLVQRLSPKTADFAISEDQEVALIHFPDYPRKTYIWPLKQFPSLYGRKLLEGHNKSLNGTAKKAFDMRILNFSPEVLGKGNIALFDHSSVRFESNVHIQARGR